MDRRIFDMLEMYSRSGSTSRTDNNPKECFNDDYCLKTNYNDDKMKIFEKRDYRHDHKDFDYLFGLNDPCY